MCLDLISPPTSENLRSSPVRPAADRAAEGRRPRYHDGGRGGLWIATDGGPPDGLVRRGLPCHGWSISPRSRTERAWLDMSSAWPWTEPACSGRELAGRNKAKPVNRDSSCAGRPSWTAVIIRRRVTSICEDISGVYGSANQGSCNRPTCPARRPVPGSAAFPDLAPADRRRDRRERRPVDRDARPPCSMAAPPGLLVRQANPLDPAAAGDDLTAAHRPAARRLGQDGPQRLPSADGDR
jgi:hypothetical protein